MIIAVCGRSEDKGRTVEVRRISKDNSRKDWKVQADGFSG
jgi:hypothetical protein